MNPIVINMDDMSDSTEVYSSRPSPIFAILIWTLAGILVIALVWMGLFRIDLVTHADGMIRSGSATATITNTFRLENNNKRCQRNTAQCSEQIQKCLHLKNTCEHRKSDDDQDAL